MQHNPLSVRLTDMMAEAPKIGKKFHSLLCFSSPELALLATLARRGNGSMTMSEISELFDISKPAATQLVERLCAKGCLERCRDAQDKRIVRVRMTQDTERAVDAEIEQILSRGDRVIARFGEKQMEHLLSQFEQLREIINQEIQEEATV